MQKGEKSSPHTEIKDFLCLFEHIHKRRMSAAALPRVRRTTMAMILIGLHISCASAACTAWRQTGGCMPSGEREPGSDRTCDQLVPEGASGYCECDGGRKVMEVGCGHPTFICQEECAKAANRGVRGHHDAGAGTCAPGDNACSEAKGSFATMTSSNAHLQSYRCLGWRQTSGCDPNGRSDKAHDQDCRAVVPSGASGFCECEGTADGRRVRVRLSECDHPTFSCQEECHRASHYFCLGWRQTGNCTADGPREESLDLPCGATVPAGVSGYCECGTGATTRRVPRPPGCSKDDESERCEDVCKRGEGLYALLGLAEGASESSIKQAFRRLSLKLHPDKQRSAEAREQVAARFAEVRDAYDILSSPDARILYDMHGIGAAKDKANRQRENSATVEQTVSLANVYKGGDVDMVISRRVVCKGCAQSSGRAHRARCRRCGECPPEVQTVQVQFAPGFLVNQQQEVPSEERCEQQQYRLEAAIKRGASDGDVITFARAGEQRPGRIPGDVLLKLKVADDARFKRRGSNLHTTLSISLREALLGFNATITHLDGHRVHIERRGVTKPGMTFEIAGEGLSETDDDGVEISVGALFVKADVAFPDALNEDARRWAREVLPP